MHFQKIVLIIATILLIMILLIIGLTLSKKTYLNLPSIFGSSLAKKINSLKWPPIVGECPDYWVDISGNGEACFNSHRLGKCNIPNDQNKNTMNFNTSAFNGPNEKCAKYTWAKNCNITWDGITSGIKNPCDTTNIAN